LFPPNHPFAATYTNFIAISQTWIFPMRFWLLDRICSYQADTELTASKNVSLSEDYLADHFPEFPVLPGVFMLEAATQAGAWLVRLSEKFAHSVVVLHEAKAVKFADFVTPGQMLRICVKQNKRDGKLVHMRFQGEVDGQSCVSGRLVLECSNLADDHRWIGTGDTDTRGDGSTEAEVKAARLTELALIDQHMIDALRTQAAILTRGILTEGSDRIRMVREQPL
jgi:3-hydroxyacyl-[acyl-carrier-protein] dehydratase